MNARVLPALLGLLLVPASALTGATDRGFVPGRAATSPMSVLRHSHVAGWFDEPDNYLAYPEVDVIVQDLDITDEAELPKWRALGAQWHAQGKLFFAELRPATPLGRTFETLMEDPGLRAAACVDMNGEPIGPGWQRGRTHQGHPVRFFCSNNPRYRSFLRYLIYLYHEAGADGLFVDDAGGNPASQAEGGCLCPHCVAGFRTFLGEKYPSAQWQALGFGPLGTFDYRAAVSARAKTRAEFRTAREHGEIPLAADFAEFLRTSDAELFRSLHAQMDQICGRHVPMAWDNFNFSAARLPYYPTLDALAPEIAFSHFTSDGRGDNTRFAPATILLNRLADGLGKWYSPIPAPITWKAAKAGNLTGLLRLWIVATYAGGGLPRYPRKGWAGINDGVVDWYYPPKEAFAPLYDFVRTNRALFDDYENLAQVGVVYAEQSPGLAGPAPIKHAAEALVNANIPFAVLVAGSDKIPQRLAPADARRFDLVLVPADTKLDAAAQPVVDEWKKQSLALSVSRTDDLAKLLAGRVDPLVALASNHDVRLFPRVKPGDGHAPVVCHLVNWAYDSATNHTPLQTGVEVRLRRALTGGAKITRIVYHTIGRPAQPLDFTVRDGAVHVTVPEIALWAVLEINLT